MEDQPTPSCSAMRELVSADADDELGSTEQTELAVHLATCAACARFADRVAAINRQVRVRPVPVDHDLVARVVDRHVVGRLGRGAWLRPALAWCGGLVAVQSVRPLFLADLDGAEVHVARHVGASAMALAIAFLYAAWRPHRAAGMLPFVAALLVTTVVGAVFDTISGDRTAVAELVHVAEVLGLVLLWLVAGSPGLDRLSSIVRRRRGAVPTTSP